MLPVEVEDSPGLVAGGELAALPGSAGSPVSCAETGAGSAGMQVGSLLVMYNIGKQSVIWGKMHPVINTLPCKNTFFFPLAL